MGLLRILKKTKEKEKEIRLLVLQVYLCRGLDNAGKTTMIKKLNGEDTSTISPTLGFNIKTFEFKNYRLNIWDVGGQTTIRSYWRNYFEQTDGLIWVVDSGDQLRLETCKQELHALLQQERLAGASLLVIANKQDVANALKKENIKDFLQLDKIIARHWAVVECSSITGKGLRTAFDWVVNDIASRIFLME